MKINFGGNNLFPAFNFSGEGDHIKKNFLTPKRGFILQYTQSICVRTSIFVNINRGLI